MPNTFITSRNKTHNLNFLKRHFILVLVIKTLTEINQALKQASFEFPKGILTLQSFQRRLHDRRSKRLPKCPICQTSSSLRRNKTKLLRKVFRHSPNICISVIGTKFEFSNKPIIQNVHSSICRDSPKSLKKISDRRSIVQEK